MEEKKLFKVTSNPIVRTPRDTGRIMLDVIIALVPALGVGAYMFGLNVAVLLAVNVAACVFFEWGYRKLLKKNTSVGDLSAVVTGMLLTCVMPSSAPWWVGLIGSFFAIVVVKQLYGGIGKNFLNPALAGRAFLTAAYAAYMTNWAVPGAMRGVVDGTSMATPLSYMHAGEALPEYYNFLNMFLGGIPGSIGEISTLAILIGAAYLLIRKVITWRIPVFMLGSMFLFAAILWLADPVTYINPLFHVLAGGALLGAFFMATDYVTSPMSKGGQVIYAIGIGVISILIRVWGAYPEGVSFAILIMNATVPLINKYMKPSRFGARTAQTK